MHRARPAASLALLLALVLAACATEASPVPADPTEVFSRLSDYDYVRAPLEVEAGIRAGLRTSDLLEGVGDVEVRSVVREGVPITMIASVVLTGDGDPESGAIRDRLARTVAGFPPAFEERTVAGADVEYASSGAVGVLAWEPHGRVVVMVGSHVPGPGMLDVAELLIGGRGGDPGPLLPFTAPDPVSAFPEGRILRYRSLTSLSTALQEEFQTGPLEPAGITISAQQAGPASGPPLARIATVVAIALEPEYASTPEFPELLTLYLFGDATPRTVVVAGRPIRLFPQGDEVAAVWPDRLGLWVAAYAPDEATALEVAELMIEAREAGGGLEPTA